MPSEMTEEATGKYRITAHTTELIQDNKTIGS